jgi:hypothetical protein
MFKLNFAIISFKKETFLQEPDFNKIDLIYQTDEYVWSLNCTLTKESFEKHKIYKENSRYLT